MYISRGFLTATFNFEHFLSSCNSVGLYWIFQHTKPNDKAARKWKLSALNRNVERCGSKMPSYIRMTPLSWVFVDKAILNRKVPNFSPFMKPENTPPCVISGFPRKVDWNCALLGHYAASSANFLTTFRDNISRNFGKKLSLLAA
jgi:hypothetical protein